MMLQNFLVALACLIQGFRSESFQDVVTDLTPQIAAQKTQTSLIILRRGDEVGSARVSASKTVALGEKTLGNQINQLGDLIDEARDQAKEQGKDVQSCINSASGNLFKLELNSLAKCRIAEELDYLGVRLAELGTLVNELSVVFDNTCKDKSSVEEVRSCVEDLISFTKSESGKIEEIIDIVCTDAKKNAAACVQVTLGELDLGIDRLSHELKYCLQSVFG